MTLSKLNMTDWILLNVRTLKESVECEALFQNKRICFCKVNHTVCHIWTISSWFTNENWQGQGIGKKTLAKVLSKLYEITGIPKEIKYIWNGTNETMYWSGWKSILMRNVLVL